MIRIMLVGAESEFPSDFTAVLEKEGARIVRARTGAEALSKTGNEILDLIVIGEKLPDATGLGCAQTLISSDAFLNCALASSLSPEEFHEASEGLGLLMQLPAPPGREEAGKLLERLKKILNLTNVKGI